MAIIRWEPAREIGALQHEMNRLFGSFFDAPTAAPGTTATARRWIPAMDLVETADEYVLRADLPGMSESDVDVSLEDDVLTVSGERKSEHEERGEGFYRVERASGSFRRSLSLPEGVDAAAIAATFDKGVLEVRIPKPQAPQPRKVQIHVGDRPAVIDAEAGEAPAPETPPAE